ncbi:phosphate transport system permease protein [Rubricella aquisinus]|uniref:Phosphate transport system permease protein PstA n=1 Tax=Rubricella aquisinus TaxID=2028108 RepID=A0A840WGL6_9RHOB|nr:phosphate ABC transporter permease PstA [Rubricella aquisinus]MBB5514279.1 phosphate transport system permease protein [Rubricella aquisinus]
MTELSKVHGSKASADRLKKRRAAEWRLKAYGIAAIAFAGAALVILLSSVVLNARFAITETYINAEITIPQEVDPGNTRDPEVIGQARFANIVRDEFRDMFPYVSGRSNRRELSDLYSSGAVFELRDYVMENPEVVGDRIEFEFVASDVTDLYMKGAFGTLEPQDNSIDITLDFIGDDTVEIVADAPIFSGMQALVRQDLVKLADRRLEEAGRQDAGVIEFERRASVAETEEERALNQATADARAVERDRLRAEADDLMNRSRDPSGFEQVLETNPSVYMDVNEGWLRITGVGTNTATAEIVVPMAERITDPASYSYYINEVPQQQRPISDQKIIWIEELRDAGAIETKLNWRFFQAADSTQPELAGVWGAIVGSFWTLIVTATLAVPIGVLAAVYLEEFAPKNRVTDFIEVNINNLAAVPSIVFGLLGVSILFALLQLTGQDFRQTPIIGGIVLALMSLPTIIIASRASIRAVPPSIRDAALGLGASKLQSTFHHVLPLALPGILTGTIIAMAQALGETAPLILVGLVAFITEAPTGPTDSSTVLPVIVFSWSGNPERAFEAKTAAAICVLLLFLIIMNALAVFLRKRFERRW